VLLEEYALKRKEKDTKYYNQPWGQHQTHVAITKTLWSTGSKKVPSISGQPTIPSELYTRIQTQISKPIIAFSSSST